MRCPIPISVPPRTIVTVLAWLALALLLVKLVDLLLLATVALILTAALAPAVAAFERRGWPRGVAVAAVFVLVVGVVGLLGVVVVPVLVDQARALSHALPGYSARLTGYYAWFQALDARFPMLPDLEALTAQLSTRAAGWLANGVTLAGRAAGLVANVALVLAATFFLLLDAPALKQGLLALLPPGSRRRLGAQVDPIAAKLGGYVQGLGISIGFLTCYLAIAMTLAGVPMALVLALLAGMLEVIPLVGSLLGSIPAILIAAAVSWQLALITLGIFMVGNFLQGNLVAPFAFSRSVALSPVLVMLALAVGAELFGFAGALVAVPVLATIQVLLQNLYVAPREAATAGPRVPTFDEPLPVQALVLESGHVAIKLAGAPRRRRALGERGPNAGRAGGAGLEGAGVGRG